MYFEIVVWFILILLGTFSIYKSNLRKIINKTKNWSVPPTLPLIGNLHHFLCAESELFERLVSLIKKYGQNKCMKLWLGFHAVFIITKCEDVEIVLTSPHCINKGLQYDAFSDWLREGLLVSKDKKWYQRRRMLTPSFHFAILKNYIEVFDRHSRIFVEKLKGYNTKNESFDIFNDIGLLALDIACESVCGVKIDAQSNLELPYAKSIKIMGGIIMQRILNIWHIIYIFHRFSKLYQIEQITLKILHNFTDDIIKKRRKELENENLTSNEANNLNNNSSPDNIGIKRKMCFLDILLKSAIDGKPLSDSDIREEVDSFMFAAHDTISTALSFFFYNLSIYPEYQEKCYDEIISVFGTDNSQPVTFDDLHKLPFLEMCIKENFRLYPPVPIITRRAAKDIRLSDGKILPAGGNACIIPSLMSRSEENFEDPDLFEPERFYIELKAGQSSNFAILPFSAGQRNCIGQKFAMLELKTIIVNTLRHFVIEFAGDPKEEFRLLAELTLRTDPRIKLKVRRRGV